MKSSVLDLFKSLKTDDFPLFALPFFKEACKLEVEEEYILLSAALFQEWTWDELNRFLSIIIKSKSKFWELPAPFQEEVQGYLIDSCIPKSYAFNSKVPGVIWGVGEFIRMNPDWRKSIVDFESAKNLSSEIFYFGSKSEFKPKVRRLIIMLKLYFGQSMGDLHRMALPLSHSAINFFKDSNEADYFFTLNTWEKMKFYNSQCLKLSPLDPLLAYSKIEVYSL